MPGKSVPLSVRVSDEDALFLAGLEIDGAVTPSEKLRAILHETRRREEGMRDPGNGGLLLRDMMAPARQSLYRLEAKAGQKSDVLLKLYERLPDLMARLIMGPAQSGKASGLDRFEKDLLEDICVLIKDYLALGLTRPIRVHNEENFLDELKPIVELVELLNHQKFKMEKEKS